MVEAGGIWVNCLRDWSTTPPTHIPLLPILLFLPPTPHISLILGFLSINAPSYQISDSFIIDTTTYWRLNYTEARSQHKVHHWATILGFLPTIWVVLFHHSIKISFLKSYIKSNNRRAKPCNKHSLAGSFLFGGRPKNVVLAPDLETTCLLLHLSPIITNTRRKLPTMPPFCSGFHTKLLKTGDFAGVLLQEITFQQRKRIKDDYQKKESIQVKENQNPNF